MDLFCKIALTSADLHLAFHVNCMTSTSSFTLRMTSAGKSLCAMFAPSEFLSTDQSTSQACIPGDVKCGWMCSRRPNCTSYNYRVNTNLCELFDCTPQNFSYVAGCLHFLVSSALQYSRFYWYVWILHILPGRILRSGKQRKWHPCRLSRSASMGNDRWWWLLIFNNPRPGNDVGVGGGSPGDSAKSGTTSFMDKPPLITCIGSMFYAAKTDKKGGAEQQGQTNNAGRLRRRG